MEKFQFTSKINAASKLDWAEKSLLNYILSFIENENEFYQSNESLALTWNVSCSTIKRHLKTLTDFRILKSNVNRKKHTVGAATWYNKRYLTVDFQVLENFLNGIIISQNEVVPAKVEIIAETALNEALQPSKTIITTEPIVFGNYDEKDTMTDEKIAEIFGESAPTKTPEQPENGLTIEQMISTIRNSPELSNLGRTILTEYSNWDRNRLFGFYDIWSNNAAEKLLASKPQVYAEAG